MILASSEAPPWWNITDSMSVTELHRIVVGTFNTPELFVLCFDAEKGSLQVERRVEVIGNHSWLALSQDRAELFATCWTEPPSIAAYSIDDHDIALKRTCPVQSRSGYVTSSADCAYSAGGPSGEVIGLKGMDVLQEMDYLTGRVRLTETGRALAVKINIDPLSSSIDDPASTVKTNGTNGVSHSIMDFGGLRHGAHSADLSPDGGRLYVADIGRNCVWVHRVLTGGLLTHAHKVPSPRSNDGPRHVWPHPNGKVVYVLQEHSCMVDVFRVTDGDGELLRWEHGVRIIPEDEDETRYWADEVRTVAGLDMLVASTRGLESDTKGYVALFRLQADGTIQRPDQNRVAESTHAWLDILQTPTSGGWANAVEPCGRALHGARASLRAEGHRNEGEYIALTDSEEGLVIILAVEYTRENKPKMAEVARLSLGKTKSGLVRGAATALWL